MHDVVALGGVGMSPALSEALQQALWSKSGLLESLPIGVYVCDANGIIVQYNRKAAEFWGQTPAPGDSDLKFCGSHRLYLPDGSLLPHAATPMAEALRTARAQRNREVWIERPDGTRMAALVNIDPLLDDDGRLIGAVNCFQDITARKQAEERVEASERRLHQLLEALPAAIYTTDAEGRITYYNKAAVELSGRRPTLGSDEWCVTWRLYNPDGTRLPHDQCPMAVALKENRPVRNAEAMAERPDGSRIPFIPYPTPLHDESGALTGAINMLIDVSELWKARSDLQSSVEFNRKILDSTRDCIKVLDLDGRLTSINACGLAYLELDDVSGLLGRNYTELWEGADHAAAKKAVRRARNGKVGRFAAYYRTPSGRDTWWDEVVSPILDRSGEPQRLLVVSRDITEIKQADAQRKLLIDELNHRVKNMLATVQSIAGQTFRGTGAPDHTVRTFEARLLALSRAHEHLSNAGWKSADFRSVLNDILVPFHGGNNLRIQLRGAPVRLPPRATVTLAMVIHELATNAAKYGSLSAESGRLSVSWGLRRNGVGQLLRISWRESGGPHVRPPGRTGFGSRLIERGVAHELNGLAKLNYAEDGLRCRLEIPLLADSA